MFKLGKMFELIFAPLEFEQLYMGEFDIFY